MPSQRGVALGSRDPQGHCGEGHLPKACPKPEGTLGGLGCWAPVGPGPRLAYLWDDVGVGGTAPLAVAHLHARQETGPLGNVAPLREVPAVRLGLICQERRGGARLGDRGAQAPRQDGFAQNGPASKMGGGRGPANTPGSNAPTSELLALPSEQPVLPSPVPVFQLGGSGPRARPSLPWHSLVGPSQSCRAAR